MSNTSIYVKDGDTWKQVSKYYKRTSNGWVVMQPPTKQELELELNKPNYIRQFGFLLIIVTLMQLVLRVV